MKRSGKGISSATVLAIDDGTRVVLKSITSSWARIREAMDQPRTNYELAKLSQPPHLSGQSHERSLEPQTSAESLHDHRHW